MKIFTSFLFLIIGLFFFGQETKQVNLGSSIGIHNPESSIYTRPQEKAYFKDGSLKKFISDNICYTEVAKELALI